MRNVGEKVLDLRSVEHACKRSASFPFVFSNTHLCNLRSQTVVFLLLTARLCFAPVTIEAILTPCSSLRTKISHHWPPERTTLVKRPSPPGTQTTSPAQPPQTPIISPNPPSTFFPSTTYYLRCVSPTPSPNLSTSGITELPATKNMPTATSNAKPTASSPSH